MSKTALLIGSTGLIGKQLLRLLLQSERYRKVVAVARKPLEIRHGKLEAMVLPLVQLTQHTEMLRADDVFCCLGTTIKLAKTKEAFRAVDFDAPVQLAKVALHNGAKQFLLVSALGANKASSIFYNRVKGEVEEEIAKLGYLTCHFLRPSLLLGDRKEHRAGEKAAQVFYNLFGRIIPQRYQAIDSAKVARALLFLASSDRPGQWVHESESLQSY